MNQSSRVQALRATAKMLNARPLGAHSSPKGEETERPAQREALGGASQFGSRQDGVAQARSKVDYHATQNFGYCNPPAPGGVLNANTQVATGIVANLDLTDPIRGSGVGAGVAANAMTDLGLN